VVWQGGHRTRRNVGGHPGKRCHQELFVGCVEWKAERMEESFVILVMGLSEDKDYVEDAPGMRDERLVSTLSNLLPHG